MIEQPSTDPYTHDTNKRHPADASLACSKCGTYHRSAIAAAGCCYPRSFILPTEHIPNEPRVSKETADRISKQLEEAIKKNSVFSELSQKYPAYFKDVSDISSLDVYQVHKLFNLQDPSGAIQHASKKLLLSGVRTGGKSVRKDIQEARDTLNRWLELNPG